MVSVVSIESTVYGEMEQREDSGYEISPPVRVRKEAFGLLFYNTEESRLTFVKSGTLLRIQDHPDGSKKIMVDMKPETQAKVKRLFDRLLKKGLICES
jgi:putative mycofactocin binding protein MftB